MPQETELKLSLRQQDVRRLLAHPLLRAHPPERLRLRNTYFDTPALALMGQHIAVRERRVGRHTLLTVKTAGRSQGGLSQRGEWEGPTRPGAFDFEALVDDTALADTLGALACQLMPVFRTDFLRRRWVMAHGGARMELALDEGSVSTAHSTDAPAQRLHQPLLELELELLSGPVASLFDLAHTLALGSQGSAPHGLWLYPSTLSKAERGLNLFLGRRPAPSGAETLTLAPEIAPVQAFAATALSSLNHLQANLSPWLILGEAHPEGAADEGGAFVDPAFVHQARVALRRLRTVLRVFAPFLPRRFVRYWCSRWRATAVPLGDLRNWDVLVTETLPRLLGDEALQPHWQPVQAWVQTQRHAAHRAAQAALQQPGHALDLLAFTHAVLVLQADTIAGQQPGLGRWARHSLREQHTALMRQTRTLLREGPQGRHALRLRVKRLRYALDCLASLLTPDALSRSRAPLVRAQNTLGRLNDLSTAYTLLAPYHLPERDQLLALVDAALARHLGQLPRAARALLRSPSPD